MGSFFTLLMAVLVVYPFWRICAKAGYPGWLGVLVVVPLANLALFYYLAFAEWPALRGEPRLIVHPPRSP